MRYPVIIHKEPNTDYGVIVPDFPGVFSGGDTLEEALNNVQEALEIRYENEDDIILPSPSPLETILSSEDAKDGAVMLISLSFDFLNKETVPVNITLPLYVCNRIDKVAQARGLSRSTFLTQAALAYAR